MTKPRATYFFLCIPCINYDVGVAVVDVPQPVDKFNDFGDLKERLETTKHYGVSKRICKKTKDDVVSRN